MAGVTESLQIEVISQLIQLSREDLMNISDFLHRSGHTRENVSDKTHISLIPHITRHLERERKWIS